MFAYFLGLLKIETAGRIMYTYMSSKQAFNSRPDSGNPLLAAARL